MKNPPAPPASVADDFISFGVHVVHGGNEAFAALITEDSRRIFDYEDVKPKDIKNGYRGYVPWGEDNELPYQILEKVRNDEVMSSNMSFNITTAYGRGFHSTMADGSPITDKDIKKFFRRNNMVKFWAEQFTDIKHFLFSVMVVILDNEGSRIVQIRHKEAINCRFETCDPETGDIEHVFYANWKDNPSDDQVDAIPLLDIDDPIGDLMVRLGREPNPDTGKNEEKTSDRMFAIVNRIPTAGEKYYPFPYYCSTFNSKWYDLKAAIPIAKHAKMKNGMAIRYIVELHKDYFVKLFESEKITDPAKKKERRTLEINNIKNFLSSEENAGKSWTSSYYYDPNGNEVKMVKITRVDKDKEGGDYIEDSEEAANIVSYAMGVHPSLIGSSPGKNKSINGTEARELFTMKQALERMPRDIMIQPFYLLNDVNDWDLEYDIPDMMLTTLDQKTDAKEVSTKKPTPDDSQND
ncbi:hypothetical protein [uncultured Sunxiuqinia sp.]|uniref:hypothetical protein n=1 Tax=uncultured Sunxiuqinia sp. TaxID=1573825 RepID=UPI002614AC86|nr:hypothetical protein [uncultured Sunxiuqinia sp.]